MMYFIEKMWVIFKGTYRVSNYFCWVSESITKEDIFEVNSEE